jgi:porin
LQVPDGGWTAGSKILTGVRPMSGVGKIAALGLCLLTATPALGQITDGSNAGTPPPSDLWASIARSSNLLGDMGGLRTWIGQFGMTFSLTETSEVLGNLTGGVQQGFAYDGLTTATLQLDTQRAFNWYGGLFNVSGLWIHGNNLSADNLLSLQTASGIEADRAVRLWELWYQQKFFDGAADIKIGQQSLDQEFMISQNALLFINTMFGWPMVPSADMPGGGPAYPLSALGVRFRAHPTNSLTILAGIYNGSPSPDNSFPPPDPQVANPSGTSFPLNGGVLAIAELQYSYPALGGMVAPTETKPLAGTYRLGFWYDSLNFADQRFDNTGLSLANPLSTGIPAMHRGDYSIYGVVDQMLWQSEEDDSRILSGFMRAMGTPETDRNLVVFSINAGLNLKDPLPGRADDTFGVAVEFAHVSGQRRELDNDFTMFGVYTPAQSTETVLEVTYQYQVTPWWQLQPDFQYVFNPSGGIVNPDIPTQKIRNEAVIGLRTNITF